MKCRWALASAALLAAVCATAAEARADDKQLQSRRGSVSYQAPNSKAVALSPNATVTLADRYFALTKDASLAQILLPDSSAVLIGSLTKVQLGFFKQEEVAKAAFIVYQGRIRFAVRHPRGAKADFTFKTATGSIGVRGTQGDIEYADGTLRVNVYELCDPSMPVEVTLRDGRTFPVTAGQSFLAQQINGIIREHIESLTQELIAQFSPDFGVPTSWDAAKGEIVSYGSGAISSATGGYGGQVLSGITSLFGKKPAPSPSPAPATCS